MAFPYDAPPQVVVPGTTVLSYANWGAPMVNAINSIFSGTLRVKKLEAHAGGGVPNTVGAGGIYAHGDLGAGGQCLVAGRIASGVQVTADTYLKSFASKVADVANGGPAAPTVGLGEIYKEGGIVAFGSVQYNGSAWQIFGGYNVQNFTRNSAGNYTIRLNVELANPTKACLMVTINSLGETETANLTVVAGAGITDITVLLYNDANHDGTQTQDKDYPFNFLVFGK